MTTLEISVCFKFVMLEKSESSYDNLGFESVVTFPEGTTQTIYDAASFFITKMLSSDGNAITIDSLCLHEVGAFGIFVEFSMNASQLKSQSEEQYKIFLETEQLELGVLGRNLTTIHGPEEELSNIKTPNLIFAFSELILWPPSPNFTEVMTAATRTRRLWIPYVLFSSESEPYQFVGKHLFEASSGDTVGLLHDAIDVHIRSFPTYDRETRYKVVVYEVRLPTPYGPTTDAS